MITKYRELFNTQFTGQKYQEFKDDITSDFNYCFHIDYVLLITLYIKTAYLSCYVEFL